MLSETRKEIGLMVAGVLVSVITFFSWAVFFNGTVLQWWMIAILAAVSIIWVVVMAMALAFLKNRIVLAVLVALTALAVAVAGSFAVGAIGGGALLLLVLISARQVLLYELSSRIHFQSWTAFGRCTKYILIGFILSLAGLLLPIAQGYVDQDGLKINEQYVIMVMKPLEPLFAEFIPGFTTNVTVDQFIDAQIKQQESSLPPGAKFPESVRNQLRRDLSQQFKQDLSGKESMGTVVAGRINSFLTRAAQLNSLTVTLILILLSFLALRALVPIVAVPLVGVIALTLWLGRQTDLISLTTVTTEVDRLEL